jgi:hypothetical protein
MEMPDPSTYGLTKADVERIPVLREQREKNSHRVFLVCASVIALLSCMLGGILALFIGIVWGFLVGLVVSIAWSLLAPRPRAFAAYERYQRDIRTYEAWIENEKRQQMADERRRKLDFWRSLDGQCFEQEVADLLRRLGHTVEIRGGSGDEGIDLVMDGETVVQCKQHASPVAPAVARELFGVMHHAAAKRGVLICPSGFTTGTVSFAKKVGLELWDGDSLIAMSNRAPAR